MTLENINYIAQTIGVVAILGTLIVLVLQGQQAAKVARAELTLNAHLQNGMIQWELVDTPEKAELMVRVLNQPKLTAAELIHLRNIVGISIGAHEALFSLRLRGLVEEPTYKRLAENTRPYMRTSNGRREWKRLRVLGSDPRFVAEIDAMVAAIEAEQATKTAEAPE